MNPIASTSKQTTRSELSSFRRWIQCHFSRSLRVLEPRFERLNWVSVFSFKFTWNNLGNLLIIQVILSNIHWRDSSPSATPKRLNGAQFRQNEFRSSYKASVDKSVANIKRRAFAKKLNGTASIKLTEKISAHFGCGDGRRTNGRERIKRNNKPKRKETNKTEKNIDNSCQTKRRHKKPARQTNQQTNKQPKKWRNERK